MTLSSIGKATGICSPRFLRKPRLKTSATSDLPKALKEEEEEEEKEEEEEEEDEDDLSAVLCQQV